MPLVRAVYHDLLRRVAERSNQGRNDRGQGGHFPWRRITMRVLKSPSKVTNTCSAVHLIPKDLRFEHGGAKLASCPGCHLTSLRP